MHPSMYGYLGGQHPQVVPGAEETGFWLLPGESQQGPLAAKPSRQSQAM